MVELHAELTQERLVWHLSIGTLDEPAVLIKLSKGPWIALSKEATRITGRLPGWQHTARSKGLKT